MNSLKDKIAFITGAATGIGRETAILLGERGATVIVTDINEMAGAETKKIIVDAGGKAEYYSLDVGEMSQIKEVISNVIKSEGKLDLAVNNAGIGGNASPLHLIDEEDWHRVLAVNLTGLFFCMQEEIKSMLQQGSGRIVNVASLAGVNGIPTGSHYSATKHGVVGLTKTAAIEYGSLNIRVNAVCPGFIQTPILENVPKEIIDFNTQYGVPMKRIGQPQEVANAIAWLLSEESSYVNGHTLYLDGGAQAS